ncbi:MAG TPA: hypothetical protein VGH27_28235 [Streptosporangiaceae bacterium]|jgi:hypothetical protein
MTTTEVRATLADVSALDGVLMVVDTGDGIPEYSEQVGDEDRASVLSHLHETYTHLTSVLMPSLGELLAENWEPARWWSCAGGDRVVIGRDDRCVVVEAALAPAFLAAVTLDGLVGGTRVW